MEKIRLDALEYNISPTKSILANVSLHINEGQIFYLVGPNGAGKTTLIKLLLGLIGPNNGTVSINGIEMNPQNRKKLIPLMGVFIEQAAFYGHLSVLENLSLHARYFKVPKHYPVEAAQLLGLSGELDKKAAKLSMGMKQRLGLAMAIVHKPEIIIFDEPTNGMDPQGVIAFRDLVQELNDTKKCTFFITTHILGEVEKMADTIAILKEGEIIDFFDKAQVLKKYTAFEIDKSAENQEELNTYCHDASIDGLYYQEGKLIRFLLPVQERDSAAKIDMGLKSLLSKSAQVPFSLEHYYLAKQAQNGRINTN